MPAQHGMRSGLGNSTRVGFGESYVHHSYDAERRFAAPPKKVAPPVDPSAVQPAPVLQPVPQPVLPPPSVMLLTAY